MRGAVEMVAGIRLRSILMTTAATVLCVPPQVLVTQVWPTPETGEIDSERGGNRHPLFRSSSALFSQPKPIRSCSSLN